jgi:hypothetical protein
MAKIPPPSARALGEAGQYGESEIDLCFVLVEYLLRGVELFARRRESRQGRLRGLELPHQGRQESFARSAVEGTRTRGDALQSGLVCREDLLDAVAVNCFVLHGVTHGGGAGGQ